MTPTRYPNDNENKAIFFAQLANSNNLEGVSNDFQKKYDNGGGFSTKNISNISPMGKHCRKSKSPELFIKN